MRNAMKEEMRRLLADFSFLSAEEYCSLYPERGVRHMPRPFGVPYYVLRNCLCAGENGQIILPPGERGGRSFVLRESFNHEHEEGVVAPALASALMHADGTEPVLLDEAVPLYPIWSLGNLWHWLYDSVPKVCVMEAAGYRGPYIANASSNVVREGLALLGIAPERLVHCAVPHLVRQTYIPQVIHWSALHGHRTLLLTARDRMLGTAGVLPGEKRCFIRRIGSRKLLNEPELLEALTDYDIEVLVPEEHSLAGQVRFISNAGLTLSPHGANSGLALFQKTRSVLMEFFGQDYINNVCNLAGVRALNLLYLPVTRTVMTTIPAGRGGSGAEQEDYRIDVRLVRTMLDAVRSGGYSL